MIIEGSLQGPDHGPLCARLTELLGERAQDLYLGTVLGLEDALRHRPEVLSSLPARFLLFDLQRIVLYERGTGEEMPQVISLVRFLIDAFPFQPLDLLRKALHDGRYRFLYELDSLDILPFLLRHCRPGVVSVCNLATAEIRRSPLRHHPECPAGSDATRGREMMCPPARAEFSWKDRWTDASLRARRPPDLGELVSADVGPIREQRLLLEDFPCLPIAGATFAWDEGRRREVCYGRSFCASEAMRSAQCEALERFQVVFRHSSDVPLIHASFDEVRPFAVDPRRLFYGWGDAMGEPGGLSPFDERERLYWTWAFSPVAERAVLVPAQEVWFNTRHLPDEHQFIVPTTNGCALGSSVEEAALFALLEAIERDGLLIFWYLRRRCEKIDPASIDLEEHQLLLRRWHLLFSDYDLHLLDATTDVAIPTVLALAIRRKGEGPKVFLAAASRLTFARACFTALKDLTNFQQNLKPERRERFRKVLADPRRASGPEDHFGLYALDEAFERLSFLDFTGPEVDVCDLGRRYPVWTSGDRINLWELWERIAVHLEALGAAALVKDITHPELAPFGLRCAKVVTPGLYPLWFGLRARRFAVTDRLRRLARELTGRSLENLADFNLDLHPFS